MHYAKGSGAGWRALDRDASRLKDLVGCVGRCTACEPRKTHTKSKPNTSQRIGLDLDVWSYICSEL